MPALQISNKAHPVIKMVVDKGEVGTNELQVLLRKYYRNPRDIDFLCQEGRIAWVEERQCWIPGPRALDY